MAATTGRMLISVWGVIASASWLVLDQLADRAQPPVAEVVLVVGAG
jgi:hypothetical protein